MELFVAERTTHHGLVTFPMKIKFVKIALIVLGLFATLSIILPSGLHYCYQDQCGVVFWGAHEHDGVWHLAVARTLFSHFPFEMPDMSGVMMSGYNYLLDLVIAIISSITRLSHSFVYFQLIPIVWYSLYVVSTFRFARSYSKSKVFPLALLFFNFFGSSLAYLLTLRNHGTIWGSSGLLSMQSLQNLLNVQFALSLIPMYEIMTGLSQNKREWKDYLKYGIYVFIILGLKFYTGVGVAVYLITDYVVTSVRQRKIDLLLLLKNIVVGVFFAISALLFYAPTSSNGSPLMYKPLATVRPIIEDSSLLYLPKRAEQLYNLHGIKLFILELGVLGVFILFNYGSRVFASIFAFIGKRGRENDSSKSPIVITAIVMLLISILFVQRGVWWNTVQFLYVSLFLTNVLAAEGISNLFMNKKTVLVLLAGLIVASTIPTNLDILRSFVRFPGSSYIPDSEMQALNYLSTQDKGVVLSDYLRPNKSKAELPTLVESYDTSYISAYSGQQSYLNDLVQLELTNIDYKERLAKVNRYDCSVLEEVEYVYELNDKPYREKYVNCGKSLDEIFKNERVTIYQVR